MREINPEKGLYTEAEFDQALSDGEARQDAKTKKEEVEHLAEMPLDGDDVLREGDTFVAPDEEPVQAEGFSVEQARTIDTITLLRIYDLLGAILNNMDEDMAMSIIKAHEAGKLVGPEPVLNF